METNKGDPRPTKKDGEPPLISYAMVTNTNEIKEAGNNAYGIIKGAAYTIAFDVSNVQFENTESAPRNIPKINMTGEEMIGKLAEHIGGNGVSGGSYRDANKILELSFFSQEEKDLAMEEYRSNPFTYNGVIFRPSETYDPLTQFMRIRLRNLPNSREYGVGEVMESTLKQAFSEYGKVVSAIHHRIPGSKTLYSYNATVILIPNNEVIDNPSIIIKEIEMGEQVVFIDLDRAPKICHLYKKK
jgi:hypothetical protein